MIDKLKSLPTYEPDSYHGSHWMEEDPDGEYVKIDDVIAVVKEYDTIQYAAAKILKNRWGGYGYTPAMEAMWNYVYDMHGRHMLPQSHYDGVFRAALEALANKSSSLESDEVSKDQIFGHYTYDSSNDLK